MTATEIFNLIKQHTCEVIPELENHNFVETDSLRDLGANSVDRSEIVMMTLESLDLNIPLIHIARAENMGELSEILHEKLQ